MKNRKTFLMALIVILYFSIIFPFLAASNSATVKWYRTWGGSSEDIGGGVAVDSFDNVYISGWTRSFDPGFFSDLVLVKYDSSGVQQWNHTWGGVDDEAGWGVAVDSSDNVYVSGYTYSFGAGDRDMVLVKYDSSGVLQWNRTWGGVDDDGGGGVAVDSSDNVYVSGYTYSFGAGDMDMVLVKYDSSGVLQWNRTWGGSSEDAGWGVAVDSSGNVYRSGWTYSFGEGDSDLVLMKYDSSGVLQWNRTWGGSSEDEGLGAAVDSSDNVYVSGRTESFGAVDSDLVLVKYDSSGVLQWNRTWSRIFYDRGTGVAFDSSDNVYVTGYTWSAETFNDFVLVKYDSSGVQQWHRTWGGTDDDYGWGVAVNSSDNVYLSGYTESFGEGYEDMVLVKYDIEDGDGVEDGEDGEEPAISGYDLLLFISVIGVIAAITAIFLKKKYMK